MVYPLFTLLLLLPTPVLAYVGSGIGLSAIAALFTLGLAIITTIWGFIWQPVKKYLNRYKKTDSGDEETPPEEKE